MPLVKETTAKAKTEEWAEEASQLGYAQCFDGVLLKDGRQRDRNTEKLMRSNFAMHIFQRSASCSPKRPSVRHLFEWQG